MELDVDGLEIDQGDEQLGLPTLCDDQGDTGRERAEFVGEYPSVEAYIEAQLEPELSDACLWLLDCLDMNAVLQRFSIGGKYRFIIESGRVYRVGPARKSE